MSKLIIQTQHRENYGAHDWDGVGECPQYWKCKGGDTYVVRDLRSAHINKIAEHGIPTLTKLIESQSEYFEEYIVGWEVVEDDVPECEEWESPTVLTFDPEGREWVAERITLNDEHGFMRNEIAEKREFWVPQPSGHKDCYTQEFIMQDGDVLGYNELSDRFAKEGA